MNLSHLIMTLGLAGYAISSILFLLAFPKVWEHRMRAANAAFVAFSVATVAMTYVLLSAYLCWSGENCPRGPFSGLMLTTVISWLTILGYFRFKMKILGTFVAPIATTILLIEFFTTPAGGHVEQVAPTGIIMFHIAMAVTGEAFAILACAVAILYLMQQRVIKTKQLNFLAAIAPPLDRLHQALFISLWSGFIFLTIGLVTGAASIVIFSANHSPGLEWKITWAMTVWLWYLAILIAKNIFNFPGRRVAQMCLFGCILLALWFFGLFPWGATA